MRTNLLSPEGYTDIPETHDVMTEIACRCETTANSQTILKQLKAQIQSAHSGQGIYRVTILLNPVSLQVAEVFKPSTYCCNIGETHFNMLHLKCINVLFN